MILWFLILEFYRSNLWWEAFKSLSRIIFLTLFQVSLWVTIKKTSIFTSLITYPFSLNLFLALQILKHTLVFIIITFLEQNEEKFPESLVYISLDINLFKKTNSVSRDK